MRVHLSPTDTWLDDDRFFAKTTSTQAQEHDITLINVVANNQVLLSRSEGWHFVQSDSNYIFVENQHQIRVFSKIDNQPIATFRQDRPTMPHTLNGYHLFPDAQSLLVYAKGTATNAGIYFTHGDSVWASEPETVTSAPALHPNGLPVALITPDQVSNKYWLEGTGRDA
jgi:hypothetical protein